MSRLVSFYLLIAIIVVIGLTVYRVLLPFLVPLFMASLLVVMFRPMHRKILERCNNRHHLAAGLSTAAILLAVLLPGTLVVTLAGIEGSAIIKQLDETKFIDGVIHLRQKLGLEMPFPNQFRNIQRDITQVIEDIRFTADPKSHASALKNLAVDIDALTKALAEKAAENDESFDVEYAAPVVDVITKELTTPSENNNQFRGVLRNLQDEFQDFRAAALGGSYRASLVELLNPSEEELRKLSSETVSKIIRQRWAQVGADMAALMAKLILGLVITVVATFFFFADGPAMIRGFMRLSPLNDQYEHELLSEFDRISRAVVVATLLSAVVQGLLAGIGFWFVGLDSIFLLILLTTFLALIPFVGAAAVWAPAAMWLYFIDGRTGAAIGLAIYGAAIVSTSDNIIKPLVLHGQSRLHPLLALLSVLGGVQALGPIGIIVGPMVVVFLQTLLNILHREIITIDTPKTVEVAGNGKAVMPEDEARARRRQRRHSRTRKQSQP